MSGYCPRCGEWNGGLACFKPPQNPSTVYELKYVTGQHITLVEQPNGIVVITIPGQGDIAQVLASDLVVGAAAMLKASKV